MKSLQDKFTIPSPNEQWEFMQDKAIWIERSEVEVASLRSKYEVAKAPKIPRDQHNQISKKVLIRGMSGSSHHTRARIGDTESSHSNTHSIS